MTLSINGKTYEAGELVAYVKELEKENAELREESKKTFNDWLESCNKYGEVNLKLTKAKDILRMIVYWKSDKKELLNFINKAEQFLKG